MKIQANKTQEALRYIGRIRNVKKYRYAAAVLEEMLAGRDGSGAYVFGHDDLSFMARQGVRHQLAAILTAG